MERQMMKRLGEEIKIELQGYILYTSNSSNVRKRQYLLNINYKQKTLKDYVVEINIQSCLLRWHLLLLL